MNFKKILWALGALVLVYMGKSVLVDPRVSDYNDEADGFESAAAALNQRVAAAQAVQANLEQFEADLASYKIALPNEPDIDFALADLRQVFETSGLLWTSFAPTEPPAPEPATPFQPEIVDGSQEAVAATSRAPVVETVVVNAPVEMKASITAKGDMASVARALTHLRSMDRLAIVDSVSVSGPPNALTVAFEVRFFMYDPGLPDPVMDPSIPAPEAATTEG